MLIKITIKNHASEEATLSVLPTLWFRNAGGLPGEEPPGSLSLDGLGIAVDHPRLSGYRASAAATLDGATVTLFCDRATNNPRLFEAAPLADYPKDGINDHVITWRKHGESG